MPEELKRLSRFLALILRHKPDEFGLTLDNEGFTDVNAVWTQIQKRFPGRYSHKDLLLVLNSEGGKQRFELRNGRLRAMYGHSIFQVQYPPAVPPEILYHGTVASALPLIRKDGLTAQTRAFVHLSTVVDRANDVAGRHGADIVLLTIRALEAHNAGLMFYHPEPKHYLITSVPPEYINFPED